MDTSFHFSQPLMELEPRDIFDHAFPPLLISDTSAICIHNTIEVT